MPDLMRHLAALFLFAMLAASAPAQTAPGASRLGASLDSLVRAAAAEHRLPSVVVGVIVDGERRIFGAGEVGGAAPDAHTFYEIGSISKVLTSLALADAVTRGETTLDTPVADLLGAPVGAHAEGPIRLVDLATHTSGLPRIDLRMGFAPGFNMADPYAGYTPDMMLASLAAVDPASAPGATFGYSNWGAGLLGYALARHAQASDPARGSSYGDLVRQRVLEPLGMNATWLAAPDSVASRLAPAHGPSGQPVPFWTLTDASAGAGGWRSTADDLLTLAQAVLAPSGTPLADALALTLEPRADAGSGREIGLGWFSAPFGDGRLVWHNGMVGGSAAFVGVVPERGVAVVILTNRQHSLDAWGVEILQRLVTD